MGEETRRGGDGARYEAFAVEAPAASPNGHGERARRREALRGALRGVPGGLLVTGLLATSIVPRLSLLNLAFYEPWRRPVVAAGLGGLAAGVARRGRAWGAALAGSAVAVLGLWAVYGMTRAQYRVLFVDRDPVRVVAADLARLAAYAFPAGALGGLAGRGLRAAAGAVRARRERPITRLPGFGRR